MKSVERFLPYIVILLLVAPLAAHVVLGTYNRGLADDFCFTVTAEQNGLLGNLDHWYNNWTGTYSSTFFQSVIGLMRAWQLVPSTLVILWFAALTWLMFQFAAAFKLRRPFLCAVGLAAAVLYGVVAGTANVYQSFYWTSGAITYTLPLIVFTFLLGVIVYALRSDVQQIRPYLMLCAGCVMLAGGFAPFYAVFQVVFFAIIWLGIRLFAPEAWRHKGLTVFGVGFIFACMSFVILFVAPGNTLRRARFDLTLSFGEVILTTLRATVTFIPTSVGFLSPMAVLVPLILSGTVAFLYHPLTPQQQIYFRQHNFRWIGLITGVALIFMTTCFFMTVYSIHTLPPPRAYVLLQLILVCTAVAWGYLMGLGLQKEYVNHPNRILGLVGQIGILAVLVLGPLRTAQDVMALAPDLEIFASEWDVRHARLTQAAANGEIIGEIEPLSVDLGDIAWIEPSETCIRSFYIRE